MIDYEIDEAFAVDAKVRKNVSVKDYQYFSYSKSDPNLPGRLELRFDDTSKYYLPAEAFIEFEGQLTAADGTAYANLNTSNI